MHNPDFAAATVHLTNAGCRYSGAEQATIHGIDLIAQPGAITLICGASGSGKSSILRLINGLVPHFHSAECEGEVILGGDTVPTLPLAKIGQRCATVLQNPRTQFFTTSVAAELAFAGQNFQVPREEILRRIADSLAAVGVTELATRSLSGLSGGQLQKVACAQALAQHTDILLFDEPTSNLDAETIDELAELLTKLKTEGKTLLIAEHRLYFLRGLVDNVVLMENGEIKRYFSGDEFFSLTDAQRKNLGLRTLNPPQLQVPTTKAAGGTGVTIEKLGITIGGTAILDIENLVFAKGAVTGIIGANGIGKTTLARVLCGLHKPDRGAVVHGLSLKPRVPDAFLVMQDVHRQLFAESVGEEADPEYLAQVGLEEFAHRHPLSLSGGQKQRLVIATALASGAQVLLFDEPTSGVDYRHLEMIATQLKNLAQAGKTVIVISHDVEFLNHCADHVVDLSQYQP